MWHTNNAREKNVVSMRISISKPKMYCEYYETKSGMRRAKGIESPATFVYSFHSKNRKCPLIQLYRFVPMGFRHEANLCQPHEQYCDNQENERE